jgi:hypothetical protein
VWLKLTDVSEVRTASIIRAREEQYASLKLRSLHVALVRKAADTRITIFKSFGARKINERVVISNTLTNDFEGLVVSVSRWM